MTIKLSKRKDELSFFVTMSNSLRKFMKIFSSYVNCNWKIFEKKIWKEYKDQDIEQMINPRFFLKKFKNEIRKNNQMRTYSRQFRSISIKLIKWNQLNIYIQCSWYLQRFSNSYRIKLIHKHNFNSFDSNIILFEFVYETVIAMIDINNALRELNVLNSKENKNSFNNLMNLIKIDQKINKSFNFKTNFAPAFVLSAISTQIIFKKIIEFFIKFFNIIYFNNARAVIVDKIQKIVNVTLYQ